MILVYMQTTTTRQLNTYFYNWCKVDSPRVFSKQFNDTMVYHIVF